MASNPFDFAGLAALVTGCGSETGIGFASARLLARLGARVAIASTTDRIETRADKLRTEGAEVSAHIADLTDRKQAFELAEAAGSVDILVNADGMVQTGVEVAFPPFRDLAPEVSNAISTSRS
jgi:3-oxoacyl-[acyl-carrier protein] reductase